jgi:hypothetical protein
MAHDQKDMWENITVSKNCPVDWNSMKGDEKIRFCGKCSQNVYNLSEMTQEEAEGVIQQQNGDLCVRLYRRADGTIITKDCPQPKIKASVWLSAGTGLASILGLAVITTLYVDSITQGKGQFNDRALNMAKQALANGPLTKVVYMAKRLKAGDTVTADSLELRDVPVKKAPIDSLHNFNQAIGKVLNYDCEAGSLISEHALRN